MAENREEVLSQLYALRGSISYMSNRVSTVLAKEEACSSDLESKERDYNLLKYGHFKGEISEEVKDQVETSIYIQARIGDKSLSNEQIISRSIKNNNNYYDIPKAKKELGTLQEELNRIEKKKNFNIAALCIGIIMILIGVILLVLPINVQAIRIDVIGGALIGFGILSLVCFILLRISNRNKILRLKSSIIFTQNHLEACLKREKEIEDSCNNFILAKNAFKRTKEEKDDTLKKLQPIYTATLKTYADMVDERDWKYLDVVIYYFETKRADSIKEALQLLDRLIQTNMIVSAVQNASKDIQSCIYNATRVLAGAIETACNRICSGLNGIVSSMDMQSALISQSNMTSEQMAEDIQYIKKVFYN